MITFIGIVPGLATMQAEETLAGETAEFVELRMHGGERRKFECRLERISLDGGGKVITLSLQAPSAQRSVQTNA